MGQGTSNFFSILFLLVQFINLNVAANDSSAQYDHRTDFTSEWDSGRWKRSSDGIMPTRLRLRVKYTNGEEIELKWSRKLNTLANQHLPVLSASGLLYQSLMTSVGDFILYEDIEKCSSVAYFKSSNTFIGHIGISHTIDELPNQFDANGNYPSAVGVPHIMSRNDVVMIVQSTPTRAPLTVSEIRHDFSHSLNRLMNENNKHSLAPEPGPSSKYPKTEPELNTGKSRLMKNSNLITVEKTRKRRAKGLITKYYLETLVFITHDVAEIFEQFYKTNSYREWIVKYCIRYFNAVETIFDKAHVNNVNFYINIAKIIILDGTNLLDFVESGKIGFAGTVSKLREHLRSSRYPPDSFDHVFMITSHQIIDNSIHVPAMTDYNPNLYQKREEGQFYNAVPFTIVEFRSSYIYGVHEISRTLDIKIEPSVEEMEISGRCDSIMQEGSSMCNRCLKWSESSVQQLRKYFRNNINRCFLLNEPRSLKPPGPSMFLSPHRQCQCYGSDSFTRKAPGHHSGTVASSECTVALQCKKKIDDRIIINYHLPPLDGTRCGSSKVCWMGECLSIKRKAITRS